MSVSYSTVSAKELVGQAQKGSQPAFAELVRRYRTRIYALALQVTGNTSDAEDITQDAFLKAYTRLTDFEGRCEFYTWVYRIALHRALNLKRDRKRRPLASDDDPRVQAALLVDGGDDPRKNAELREQYALLVCALDKLSPTLRATVVLIAVHNLAHQEAAVALSTTEGTIAWRMHEARRLLAAHLKTLETERSSQSRIEDALTTLRNCFAALQAPTKAV